MNRYSQLTRAPRWLRTIGGQNERRRSEEARSAITCGVVGNARWLIAATALLVGLLLTPIRANANDVVREWNQIALAATVTAAQGPVPQIRTMAIVHVSMHDAVNAITCDYRTYLSIQCGPWGAPAQLYVLGRQGKEQLSTEGVEGSGTVRRIVTGGTGDFAGWIGEQRQTFLGFNPTGGVNLRVTFILRPPTE
jgi:hypothetical protein